MRYLIVPIARAILFLLVGIFFTICFFFRFLWDPRACIERYKESLETEVPYFKGLELNFFTMTTFISGTDDDDYYGY